MTLEAPLFLLAGISLPILWILARREKRRRTVEVSGLLLWRRLALPPDAPRREARRWDRLLLLRLAAAAFATVGMAGPRVGGGGAAVLEVLVDVSPSMAAFGPETEAALSAVRDAAGAGTEVRVHRAPGTGDAAALLARHASGSVVVVTDHRPPDLPGGGRVRLVLVGRPVGNAGIVSAALSPPPAESYTVVVRNFAAVARELEVSRPGGPDRVRFAPGEARLFAGPAAPGRVEISLSPGDAFAFDDRVVMERAPPARPALRAEGDLPPRLRTVLLAAGMVDGGGGDGEVVTYRNPPGPSSALTIAPPGPARAVAPPVTGSGDLAPEAVPPPGLPLGPAAVLREEGAVLLADAKGSLAVLRDERGRPRVVLALDPGDPASAWPTDPSFPVFFAEMARLLGFASGGTRIVEGTVDAEESATVAEGGPPDLGGLEASPDAGGKAPWSARPLLLLVAAGLLLLHALLEARRPNPVKRHPPPGR
ncbi:MAG: BatA domain-containing protein [Planctomycetes bacterium]|nr:BatA domain-containing protein [Planctomycetota bacterium]